MQRLSRTAAGTPMTVSVMSRGLGLLARHLEWQRAPLARISPTATMPVGTGMIMLATSQRTAGLARTAQTAETVEAHQAQAVGPARAASISLPARAVTVRRADTSHLTATATALVIAAQAARPPPPAQTLPRIAIAHPAHPHTTRAIRRPARSLSRTAPSNSGAHLRCQRLYGCRVLTACIRATLC